MRIVAGSARGRRLVPPPGEHVRPTLDRVREALFNIIGMDIPGTDFLDLYAGSGANGIEALSRGARLAVFVDDHAKSQLCIRKNLETTQLATAAKVLRYHIPQEMGKIGGSYAHIFADPPYEFTDYDALLLAIDEAKLLAEGGRLIVENASTRDMPETAGALTLDRQRRYGNTTLSFYA